MQRFGLISKLNLDDISLKPCESSLTSLISKYGVNYYKSDEYINSLEKLTDMINKNKLEIIEYFKLEKDTEDINYRLLIEWDSYENKELLNDELNNCKEKIKDQYNEFGYNEFGYNEFGYNELGYNEYGYNEFGYNEFGYNEYGYNEFGYNEYGYNEFGYNEDGYNEDGYNEDGYNEDGYNEYGYNEDGYNEDGYNEDRYNDDRYNNNRYNENDNW